MGFDRKSFDKWFDENPNIADKDKMGYEYRLCLDTAMHFYKASLLAAADMVESQAFHSDFHFRMEGSEKLMADKIRHKANGDTN